MKKTIRSIGLLMALALLLSACGSAEKKSQPADAQKESLTCAAWADLVWAAAGGAQMTDVTEKYLEKTLLIQAADLADWVFRRDGEGATPEMILVLKVKDAGKTDTVRQAVQDYLEERTLQYRDYQPDQLYKLENAKVLQKDDLIALCVSPDAEKALKAFGDGWK
ncbi:MAG: DUF4358 domain-containing protein [Clostridia bacterium]|nr:DUF4358 domain-containing protein [Clostridia bacterium]